MNENKGIIPTKVELTLEQSQQGVSDDVLPPSHKVSSREWIDVGCDDLLGLRCFENACLGFIAIEFLNAWLKERVP
nr:hypothetical protein [Tanacetum cinerariifolium]